MPMLLRSAVAVASAALLMAVCAVPSSSSSLSSSSASSSRGADIPPPALLRCGGSGDPSTDSNDVLDLFGFVRAVCCDQLGEKLSQHMPNLLMPDTCTTAGGLFFLLRAARTRRRALCALRAAACF